MSLDPGRHHQGLQGNSSECGEGYGAHGVQVPLPNSKSQARLNCTIVYFNAFVVHVRVQVKCGCTVY